MFGKGCSAVGVVLPDGGGGVFAIVPLGGGGIAPAWLELELGLGPPGGGPLMMLPEGGGGMADGSIYFPVPTHAVPFHPHLPSLE